MFYADLHIHSKYSLATSRDCDLEHLALWAAKKGIALLGTGDFTHPAWFAELKQKLAPAAPGLFRLKGFRARRSAITIHPFIHSSIHPLTNHLSSLIPHPSSLLYPLPTAHCPLFMLQAEVSTVYQKDGRARKVHHVVYAPDFASARRFIKKIEPYGKLASDGRPTLLLDSRDLLEIVLGSGEGCCLVPAHIWTPWFGVLGSKSGFDSIEECYGDLAGEVFALETGLSADPATNRLLSSLDRFTAVSNSDAHSPAKLGREATIFDTALDYFSIFAALKKGDCPDSCVNKNGTVPFNPPSGKRLVGCVKRTPKKNATQPLSKRAAPPFLGTIEFFPEEGRYHHDGHRKCGVCLAPDESRRLAGKCPVCGKPLTLGVMHRVMQLADRPMSWSATAGLSSSAVGCVKRTATKNRTQPIQKRATPPCQPFSSLIPLDEVLSEIYSVGPHSKFVAKKYDVLLNALGPELYILERTALEDISRAGGPLLAEAVSRMRAGRVIRRPGFDGQYGVIRLFAPGELKRKE